MISGKEHKMSEVHYGPSRLSGRVNIPPSKSAAHRALIGAALCKGGCTVHHIDGSADMLATLNAIRAMGKAAELSNGRVTVSDGERPKTAVVDCGESGSTLRFMIPIFAALGISAEFVGHGRLPERPIGLYTELLPMHGVAVETAGGLPFKISGQLESGCFRLPGNISSQFITGLMLALPLLEGDSAIELTTVLESKGYIDLTLDVLRSFGINIYETENGWSIPGGQSYHAESVKVEGDWSQAAFFLSLAAIGGGPIELCGLAKDSRQGDMACVELWKKFGLRVEWHGDTLVAVNDRVDEPFRGLHAIDIDAAQIPDMVPALAVTAAFAEGETVIHNAARLRIKESDRLDAMEKALSAMGADVRALPDGLIINGKPQLHSGRAEGCNDHRIVMAMSAAGTACGAVVTDAQSIRKSYPGFFRDLISIGGVADVVDMGQ